jgi:hypothetical protein
LKVIRTGRFWSRVINANMAILFLIALATAACAQEKPYRGKEFWPEVNIWKRLSQQQTLLFQWSHAKGRDYTFREDTAAIYYDYRFTPTFSLRGGYKYLLGRSELGELKREHRGILNATFRKPFPHGWMLSDRNRIEARWREPGFSMRFRNRLMLEKTLRLGNCALTPYASAEVFYDSRYHSFNRAVYTLGVQIPLSKALMLDTDFTYQNDKRSFPRHLNALGVAINFRL